MINTQKRIAIFLPALYGGGAERTMLNLAQGIAERGYPVDLVLAQADGPYMAEVPRSVRLVDLNARRVLTSLPALVRYLRRERPEALLSALSRANIIALWARWLTGIPRQVVVNEQANLSISAQQSPDWRHRVTPQLARYFYRWADNIVTVSQGVADDLIQIVGIPPETIKVIYNPGITPETRKKVQAPLVHPWFEPGCPPVLLAMGRLAKQKDFGTLLRAFARLRQSQPARLLILGEGPERPMLEALVRELDLAQDVDMPGFVDNPYPFMARASAFVLSSLWEGLPTVLVEALFCGVPVVATDCPSGPYEILRGGELGGLVPMRDPVALADSMQMALAGKIPRPTRESWQSYTLETVVDRYIAILLGEQ